MGIALSRSVSNNVNGFQPRAVEPRVTFRHIPTPYDPIETQRATDDRMARLNSIVDVPELQERCIAVYRTATHGPWRIPERGV